MKDVVAEVVYQSIDDVNMLENIFFPEFKNISYTSEIEENTEYSEDMMKYADIHAYVSHVIKTRV